MKWWASILTLLALFVAFGMFCYRYLDRVLSLGAAILLGLVVGVAFFAIAAVVFVVLDTLEGYAW